MLGILHTMPLLWPWANPAGQTQADALPELSTSPAHLGCIGALAASSRPSRQRLNCQLFFHGPGNRGFERLGVASKVTFLERVGGT